MDFYAASPTPYAANGNPNNCALPPAGTVGAWSLKFTYRTSSAAQGVLTAFPGTGTLPVYTTVIGLPNQFGINSEIVPAGTDADNTINVYAQYAARAVTIDYNGYFAAQPVVTGISDGVTTLTGPVGFTGATGITVTADSGTNSVTISGSAGETGPTGPTGDTVRPGRRAPRVTPAQPAWQVHRGRPASRVRPDRPEQPA